MVFYSIGHSNHSLSRFLELLRLHRIEIVVDIRSVPHSRYSPHFGKGALERALGDEGVRYVYLGQELGGRPADRVCYDDGGHVLYGRIARSPGFLEGLQRLLTLASEGRTALMCSEEDPSACHRHLLVERVLEQQGVTMLHIRKDGRADEVGLSVGGQLPLLQDEAAWHSPRPVSRPQPKGSTRT